MSRRLRIWIDLSNTPHVLFFEPIIRELERRQPAAPRPVTSVARSQIVQGICDTALRR